MKPPRPLRTQLLLSFALVALVALVAGGSAVVWLMLEYRTQAITQRLRDAGVSAGGATLAHQRQGAAPQTMAIGVAEQVALTGARVLVLDSSGSIVAEAAASATSSTSSTSSTTTSPSSPSSSTSSSAATNALQPSLVGTTLDVPASEGNPPVTPFETVLPGGLRRVTFSPQDAVVIWRGSPSAGNYVFVLAPTPPLSPNRSGQTVPLNHYRVVLAIPAQSLPSARQELAPGLAAAAVIALLAAAGVAWALAGSIARPIRAVTRATERVARGEPHDPIPETGVLEVTQLARSFNTMARAVERSQATLRAFVADASHELRTPLTAIQGFSQAVTDGVLEAPEPTRDAIAYIHREAGRMRRLVEDLLLLSRVEVRGDPVRQDVDLAELLDTLSQRLNPLIQDRHQHLQLDVPDRLTVTGDPTQLEYLFKNLLENAVKYAPDAGQITVRATVETPRAPTTSHTAAGPNSIPTSPHAVVAVHNTGSYVAPEHVPHLFDRFYRVDRSRSQQVEGSGLGLAIAREVVERHAGTITVESDPTTGTAFTVTLPSAASTQTEQSTASPVRSDRAQRTARSAA